MHICEPFKVPMGWKVFRAMDWGFKEPGCVLWFAMDEDCNLFVVRELTFQGQMATEGKRNVAELIREIEMAMGWWNGDRSLLIGPADTQLWECRGGAAMSMAEMFQRKGIPWCQADKRSATGGRAIDAQRVAARLRDCDGGTPGLVVFSTCKNLIRTLPAIQSDPSDPETPVDGGEDHWFDALRYGVNYASRGKKALGKAPVDREQQEHDRLKSKADGDKGFGYSRGRDGYGSTI
jgi:phage terminase large subunit